MSKATKYITIILNIICTNTFNVNMSIYSIQLMRKYIIFTYEYSILKYL